MTKPNPTLHPEAYPRCYETGAARTEDLFHPMSGKRHPAQMLMLDTGSKRIYVRISDEDALRLIQQLAEGVASK